MLGLLSSGCDLKSLIATTQESTPNANGLFLSAFSLHTGEHFIAGIDSLGELKFELPVSQRAHDSLTLPHSGQALFFARRPGTHVYVVDIASGQQSHIIKALPQRHFYGHGCTSADGRFLMTSENDTKAQTGCIGVYDIEDNFRRVAEFPSFGVGPHQLKLLSDGQTLVVANGGILTHPLRGRTKLNLDTMQPSLAYINHRDGRLIDQFVLPHHQQSIRHIDVSRDDSVAIGVQFEGDQQQILPLAYTHRGEEQLLALAADDNVWRRHQQYIGSVSLSHDGQRLLLSSPRGGVVSGWNLQTRQLIHISTQRDGAGLAFDPTTQHFSISNGQGQVTGVTASTFERDANASHFFKGRIWDNHMSFAQLDS